jgi:hypothetical protein
MSVNGQPAALGNQAAEHVRVMAAALSEESLLLVAAVMEPFAQGGR